MFTELSVTLGLDPRSAIIGLQHLFSRQAIGTLVKALLLASTLGTVANAQEISGRVRIGEGLATPGEVGVVLVASDGTIVTGVLTSPQGNFTLRAPRPGKFRVRARKIGLLPDSSAIINLGAGQSDRIELALRPFPTSLARITITEAKRCVLAPAAGAAAFRLWQEAQSALTATAITSSNARFVFALHRFENKLDPATDRVTESRAWDSKATTSEPFASIPAESLAVHGFVVPEGNMLVYYAPDARVLTSDAFARTHCFHPTENAARPDLVGLAFEPTRRREEDESIRDVTGTLWLDRTTLALRSLEFQYARASAGDAPRGSVATGEVAYERLSNGAWIVAHWLIRMPVFRISSTLTASNGFAFQPGGISLSRKRLEEVATIWEAGGDVEKAAAAVGVSDSLTSLTTYGQVRGSVIDTTQPAAHNGVGNIIVTLRQDTSDKAALPILTARTDSAGGFALDSIPPGDYLVAMRSARLDTLGIAIIPRPVRVTPSTQLSFLTVIPSSRDAARRLCPAESQSQEIVLRGLVTDATDRPVAHARIVASWFNITDSRHEHFSAGTHSVATFSDAGGEYLICGLPVGQQVVATALDGAVKSASVTIEGQDGAVRMANLVLPRSISLTTSKAADTRDRTRTPSVDGFSRINGTVLDSAGQALTGASVRLDSATWMLVTQQGRFLIDHVTPGRHLVEARALGYGPHAWYVNVRSERAAIANLILQRVYTLSGVTVIAATDTMGPDLTGFWQRRRANSGGYFLGPPELARRTSQRFTDVLRSLPGVELHPVSNALGTTDYVVVMRGVSSVQGEACPIQYYMDGQPFSAPDNIDRLVPVKDLYAVEVYSGASEVPPQFKGPTARCGVIAIWTREAQQ